MAENQQYGVLVNQRSGTDKSGQPYHVLNFAVYADSRVFVVDYFVPKTQVGSPQHSSHKPGVVYAITLNLEPKGAYSVYRVENPSPTDKKAKITYV